MTNGKLFEYLKKIDDIDPKKISGSYELVKETINLISEIPISKVDCNELNLIMVMTSNIYIENLRSYKKIIDKSNLVEDSKKSLFDLLMKIEDRSRSGYYILKEDDMKDVKKFRRFKTEKEEAQKLVKFLNIIKDVKIIDEIEQITEEYIGYAYENLGNTRLSQILHYIKPEYFPLINKQGIDIYRNILGIKISNLSYSHYYLDNTKIVNRYRDIYFKSLNHGTIYYVYKARLYQ